MRERCSNGSPTSRKHAITFRQLIQPPPNRGEGKSPQISFDEILTAAKSVPEGEINGWEDIDRLDVRPTKCYVKVQARNRWEIQIDLKTSRVLQVAYRRSDLVAPYARRRAHLGAGLGSRRRG